MLSIIYIPTTLVYFFTLPSEQPCADKRYVNFTGYTCDAWYNANWISTQLHNIT